jgi:hypothetical protein
MFIPLDDSKVCTPGASLAVMVTVKNKYTVTVTVTVVTVTVYLCGWAKL